MKVKYIGPFVEGVYVPAVDLEAKPGDIIEVSDDLGVSLCDQPSNWEPGDKASAKTFADFCAYLVPPPETPADPAPTTTPKES